MSVMLSIFHSKVKRGSGESFYRRVLKFLLEMNTMNDEITIGPTISSDDMTEQEQINIFGFVVPKIKPDNLAGTFEILSVDMENKIVNIGENK